jgi:hypothetical protein
MDQGNYDDSLFPNAFRELKKICIYLFCKTMEVLYDCSCINEELRSFKNLIRKMLSQEEQLKQAGSWEAGVNASKMQVMLSFNNQGTPH